MTDLEVIKYCDEMRYKKWENRDKKIIDYLINRFNDFSVENLYDKCKESLYRLKNNINELPKCKNCNLPLKYSVKFKFYPSACCNKCMNILKVKKFHNTSLKKYGVYTPSQSNIVKEKQQITNINKYGYKSPLCNKNIKKKSIKTLIKKYNVNNIAKSNIWKDKVNQTSLIKYGTLYPNQNKMVKDKIKQTILNHYGVDNYFKTEECKLKANCEEAINKGINTKRKNNSFNKSLIEIESYNFIKKLYPDVLYQYKSKLYPFYCDFYIPSLDLYIECNYHWTHGGHLYNPNNLEDQKKLKFWKEKNTQYYNNAINCWTIRDINKNNIAKQNKLNYVIIWNFEELKEYINKIYEKNY